MLKVSIQSTNSYRGLNLCRPKTKHWRFSGNKIKTIPISWSVCGIICPLGWVISIGCPPSHLKYWQEQYKRAWRAYTDAELYSVGLLVCLTSLDLWQLSPLCPSLSSVALFRRDTVCASKWILIIFIILIWISIKALLRKGPICHRYYISHLHSLLTKSTVWIRLGFCG